MKFYNYKFIENNPLFKQFNHNFDPFNPTKTQSWAPFSSKLKPLSSTPLLKKLSSAMTRTKWKWTRSRPSSTRPSFKIPTQLKKTSAQLAISDLCTDRLRAARALDFLLEILQNLILVIREIPSLRSGRNCIWREKRSRILLLRSFHRILLVGLKDALETKLAPVRLFFSKSILKLFLGKFNSFKLLEQRSGSKALFLQKMVEVLESYFSDEGLKRNQFLAKQIQLNPEGIPLKKVAAMRRVKVKITIKF